MIVTDSQSDLATVTVFGEFTLADYKEFEELVSGRIQAQLPVNLLMDLRQMAGYTLDVAWEDIRFTRAHSHDFRKIAIVASDQWTAWRAWLSQAFVDAEVRVFDDEFSATEWLSSGE